MPMPSVYCLEGEWDTKVKDAQSVLPILDLLKRLDYLDYVHRHVLTTRDVEHQLRKVLRTAPSTFPVIYVACHGGEEGLDLGLDEMSLPELARMTEGRMKDRVLHLGACSAMRRADDELRELARRTGARAVIGYEADVDWLESASFDLLVLGRLADGGRSDAIFNFLRRQNDSLAKSLGLVVATKLSVRRARNLAISVDDA